MKFVLICVAAIASCVVAHSTRADNVVQGQANVMVEISFTAQDKHDDPFNTVTLDVLVTDPKGNLMRVPAFWDGKNVWKMRYASPIVGKHIYHTVMLGTADRGLHDIHGTIDIKPYSGTNPLYQHGPLHVSANKRYLEYNDGKPFFWLGDTWWMGLCARMRWPEDIKKLAEDRKAKGFNVVQIVAGLYPDMFPFDPRGANEAGYPWEKDYTAIRPEYFDEADKRLLYLADEGFTPCIVGAWGYFMPWMGVDKMKQHWRYLIARYGALPVVWCAAGEANLPWYLAKGFPYDDRQQVTQWTEVMKYIRATDPYHRLLTVHPTGIGRWSARHCTDDVSVLDFDMLQTPHGELAAVAPTISTMRESYKDSPRMPVIDGEASYEMLMDSIKTQWTRRMFWSCMTNGAAGHTYGANGIWQVNRKGAPHGPSPHHPKGSNGYGVIAWDDAMNLPGSAQVGFGKKFFEQFQWQKFEPHPEWAAYLAKPALSFEGAEWIWYPEGDPKSDAPAEKRYFRRKFEIPQGMKIKSARVRVSADDRFSLKVNGKAIGESAGPLNWKSGKQFDLSKVLSEGKNVLAIEAENLPVNAANPAGLIAKLEITFDNDSTQSIATDDQWMASMEAPPQWETADFNDSTWQKALVTAHYGEAPWGKLESQNSDPILGPQSTGIANEVRITYVPDPQAVELRDLGKQGSFQASWFDPTTGETHELPKIQADDQGVSKCDPPKVDHDWVLVLKAVKP
jgi:hypothetical protein